MLLVCVNQKSIAGAAIKANGSFAINVVATDQQSAAEVFSGSNAHGRAYVFDDEDWTTAITGSPVLKNAVATFDCEIETVIPAATHIIFIGRVLATRNSRATPLLYTNRSYGRPLRQANYSTGTKTVLEQICA
jgi:flavin reductase